MDRGSPPDVLRSTPEQSRIDEKDIGARCIPIHLVDKRLGKNVSGLVGRLNLLYAESASSALSTQPLDRHGMSPFEMPH
eukprot:820796-Alexandrium_andersonii.AAC.1